MTDDIAKDLLSSLAGDSRYRQLLIDAWTLHCKKAADYGHGSDPLANLRASASMGIAPWRGTLLRFRDKVHRIEEFCQKGSLANESFQDSLLDASAYSLLALILYREEVAAKEAQEGHQDCSGSRQSSGSGGGPPTKASEACTASITVSEWVAAAWAAESAKSETNKRLVFSDVMAARLEQEAKQVAKDKAMEHVNRMIADTNYRINTKTWVDSPYAATYWGFRKAEWEDMRKLIEMM